MIIDLSEDLTISNYLQNCGQDFNLYMVSQAIL